MKNNIIYLLIVGLIFFSFTPVMAINPDVLEFSVNELENIEMTIAHNAVANHQEITHAGAYYFKEFVENASKGKIEVRISPNAELGNMGSLIEMCMTGEVEAITGHTEGPLSLVYPNIQVYSIPYLFRSSEHALEVMRGDFGQELYEDMRKETGLRLLGLWDNGGFRSFSNNSRPIHTPEDMKGLKIRTMDIPAHMEIVNSLGASATPVAWDELYTALQTGVVDGQENAVPVVIQGSLYEVQDYLTLDRHVYSQIHLHINDSWFNDLPETYQNIIKLGGQYAAENAQRASRLKRELGLKLLEKQMDIYEPTAEEIEMFREKTQKPVIDFINENVDDKWVNGILNASEEAEEFLGY